VEFERYASNAVLRRKGEHQARNVHDALAARLDSLGLRLHPGKTKIVASNLAGLAAWINPVVRGRMNYYGEFNRSRLYRLLQRINTYIGRCARNKYRLLGSFKKANRWWSGLVDREHGLFAYWARIFTF
jgi:Group II intron, maturase-specific domain